MVVKILDSIIKFYTKIFSPGIFLKIWWQIVKTISFPFELFVKDPWLIIQRHWMNHYNFFYRLWQKPVLKKAKDWWVIFWSHLGGIKWQIQSIPVNKQERRALFRSLSNSHFYLPFGIIFLLIALAVLLDAYPFWRRLRPGRWRNFFAYYQYFFFRILFIIWQQFLPPKEIYVKMTLAYLDIGDIKNAAEIARQMQARFPEEKMARELVFQISQLGE
jgi:hypothetical protein